MTKFAEQTKPLSQRARFRANVDTRQSRRQCRAVRKGREKRLFRTRHLPVSPFAARIEGENRTIGRRSHIGGHEGIRFNRRIRGQARADERKRGSKSSANRMLIAMPAARSETVARLNRVTAEEIEKAI